MELTLVEAKIYKGKNDPPCKGIVCRAYVYEGVSTNRQRTSILSSIRLNVMKRLSCKGCNACFGTWDQMSEISIDWPIENLGDCENGKLYRLEIQADPPDYETGMVDSWNFIIRRYTDETKTV